MKNVLIGIFIPLFAGTVFSQTTTAPGFTYFGSSLDILYGTRLFNENFYAQLNTIGHFKFAEPVQVAGLGFSGGVPVTGRSRSYYKYGHWSYCQVIPQRISVNDTLKCNINGYLLSLDILGTDLFRKAYAFHLLASFGFNTGRLRLHGNEWARQKNPFFAPRISLQPKVRIGRLLFSIRADYEWDVSSVNWRKTYFAKSNKADLQKFKQSCLTLFFCMGYMQ